MLPTVDKNLERWDIKGGRSSTLSLRGETPACTPHEVINKTFK